MHNRIQFRMQAGLANTPLWLACAACAAVVLFLNVAGGFRSTLENRQSAAWRTLPERAMQLAAVIGRHPQRDSESLHAWLDEARRDARGQIAWLRVIDSSGATEAHSGAVIAPVDWNRDQRIQSGERSYRIVETAGGMIAVAAVPVTPHTGAPRPLLQLASFSSASADARLLEMGAPVIAGSTAPALRTSDWVNLIGSGVLALLLAVATMRRILLLD